MGWLFLFAALLTGLCVTHLASRDVRHERARARRFGRLPRQGVLTWLATLGFYGGLLALVMLLASFTRGL